MVAGLAIALIVLLLAVFLGFGYVGLKVRSVRRLVVSGLHPVGPGSTQTILLTGSDSRAGESASQAQQFGSAAAVTGQRSDVIVLIRLNPATGKAAMLSIPRDMFVPIAGTSSSNRINAAFNNGPAQLIATIEQDFGITINHYAQEDFFGLQGVTDAVGGVCMNFPYPVRDGSPTGTGNESGLNIPTAGRHTLNGAMALSLVRSRYYLYYANGRWQADGTADIGRIQRQHSFVRALAARAFHSSLTNPFTANAVLGKAVHNIKVDSSFTTLGLIRLGLNLRSLHPSAMPSFTMPYRIVNNYRQFGDVLMPEPTQDSATVAAWLSYVAPAAKATAPPTTLAPSGITIKVLNGSGVAGQARTAADRFAAAGFKVAGFGNAPGVQHGATIVAYGPGLKQAAETVAAHIGGPWSLKSGPDVAAVVVTTGTAFAGVTATAPPPTASTSTGVAAGAPTAGTAVPPWDPTPC
jgi:LCP family protein required for cell wall assembly